MLKMKKGKAQEIVSGEAVVQHALVVTATDGSAVEIWLLGGETFRLYDHNGGVAAAFVLDDVAEIEVVA